MKYLITSALPYINGVKHLGNIIGSLLPADVFARYLRQQGEEVLYICGTDEHGTPAEIAAQQEGLSIAEYCQKMYALQKEIYEGFDLQFDYFGRSSTETNKAVTQAVFKELDQNHYIIEKSIAQYYSYEDKRFLPDRYVIGTCPHCQFTKARGDQCDQCGHLLDPADLISPKSAISGSAHLELRQEKHLFIDLEKLEPKLRAWLEIKEKTWPSFSVSVANKWLNEGLQARCISRDLEWGVPIPKAGFEEKVFYVWFDAPMAYIAITQDWATATHQSSEEWKRWWIGEANDTKYVQFMAKDNLPFHSIMWPAMLLGTNTPWHTVDVLKGFHWLTYEGGKFSTSLQRGIFSDVALKLFSADYWRYYLLANIPESQDSDFRLGDFVGTINKDLVGTLGNFVNRVSALVGKYFNHTVPDYDPNNAYIKLLQPQCEKLVMEIDQDYRELNFRSLMRKIRELWCLGNEFITEAAPWTLIKTNPSAAGEVLAVCLHLIRLYSYISYPIMPTAASKIFSMLSLENELINQCDYKKVVDFNCLKPNAPLQPIGLLFEKVSPERQEELLKQFAMS